MSISVGSNIVRDGLIFGFDMGSKLSWKGRPMTNAFTNPTNLNTSSWSGGNNFAYDPTTKLLSLTSTSGGSWVLQDTSLTQSLFYTFSAEVKAASTSYAQIAPSTGFGASTYVNFDISQGQIVGGTASSYAAIKDIGGGWYRISVTMQADGNVAGRMTLGPCAYGTTRLAYSGLPIGTGIYVRSCQMEQNNYASQHVDGTRSNTEAIVDLTGNYTINASNLTYNSDGTFDFNSSNPDYLDLGSDQTIKTSGGWTVESWVKYDTVPGSYDNVNSPGNFIGSDSITYNSWYWSVLNSKLAMWNISPGIWKYGSTTLQNNTWYNAVLVSSDSGTSYQMYLNGVAEGGDHTTYSWNASYSGLKVRYIGRGNAINTRRVDGKIPIVKIYDRALSADEVLNNFEALRGRHGL